MYNCNGNDVWESGVNTYTNEWVLPTDAGHWLEHKLEESNFSIRTGNHIEHRPGMVNFSILGRNATMGERKLYVEWDEHNHERINIASAFNTMFPELQATVGGDTGIDIAPRGADKSQILRDFNENDTIHFYGDAMFEGGNDKPLSNALQKYQLGFSHQVSGWQHTWEKLREHTTNRS